MAGTSYKTSKRATDVASLPDHEIMARLKSAPREQVVAGFEVLVRRYKNAIVSFTYRYVGDYRAAEDLAQDAFVRVFRKIQEYDPTAKFSTWLYTIAGNLAKDELKRRARHPAQSLDWKSGDGADTTRNVPTASDGTPTPDASLERTETRDRVTIALAKLDVDDREIITLKDVQGLSYDDISRILSLPLGTVKSRISRARMAFKDIWKTMGA